MQIKEKKTSIVIVTYNALDYIKKCLDSVFKFTNPLHEIIIVDNCSDTSTREYLKKITEKHSQINLILNKENRLWSPGNNDGIKAAASDSEYILLLNSDTEVLREDWILQLQKPFADHKVAVTGIQHNFLPIAPMYGAIDGCCFMVPKVLFSEFGLLDEDYPWNGAGFIFSAKLWAAGYKYYHVDKPRVLIHYGKRSRIANNTQLMNQKIDPKEVMKNQGLKPKTDYLSYFLHRLGMFRVNKQMK